MDEVGIVVVYDGEWANDEGKCCYKSEKAKGLLLSTNSSYKELYEMVSRTIDINPAEVAVKMKYKYNACHDVPPIEIMNDSDVKFFYRLVNDASTRTVLCITLEPKIGLESVQSRTIGNPPAGRSASHNEHVVGLDHFPEGIFDHIGREPTYVSTSPANEASPTMESSPIDKVQNTNVKKIGSSCAMTSSVRSTKDSGSIDVLLNSVKDVGVGDFFSNKEELQLRMKSLAVTRHFQTRVNKSTKDLLVLKCCVKDCKWRLRATKLQGSESFRVRQYHPDHTCSLDSVHFDHPQASSKLIGHCIKSKYEGTSQCYRPNDIIQDMKKRFGMSLGYNKAWRAREVAMALARGSPEESYQRLALYCVMLEKTNLGTVTHIQTDASHRFKYFFMALGASLGGFRSSMRPVIAVDGTFLKCKYAGTLFVATCLDGNNQVYPLAFGVGDSENDNAWIWFLTKLHGCIGEVNDLVFISDRNDSIGTAVKCVFPTALHGICIYHLNQNMKASFKGVDVHALFYKAAKAYRVAAFNQLMSQIRGVKVEVADYLVDAEPWRWARCHFEGKRYSIMTTNIAECLNAVLKEARELPITKLIDHIRSLLQRWFWERREAAAKIKTPMTQWVESKLGKRMKKASRLRVNAINQVQLQCMDGGLNPIVNLQDRTCSCRKFQLDQLPCRHAIAACKFREMSCYEFCSTYYKNATLVAAYADSIYPVGPEDEWIVPEDVEVPIVLPPKGRKPRGRPPKIRKLSAGEDKPKRKCGRCKGYGHNRQKCRAPIPLSDV